MEIQQNDWKIMIRTTWLLFAKLEYKHHIDKKESSDKQHIFNRTHNLGQNIRQKNKQQTTHKHFICNSIEAKTTKTNTTNPNTTNK